MPRIIDPLTGPTWQQDGESDSDFAYRHAYRYAYGNSTYVPESSHSTARAYGEYTRRRFVADPSLMGTWDHAVEFPEYMLQMWGRS